MIMKMKYFTSVVNFLCFIYLSTIIPSVFAHRLQPLYCQVNRTPALRLSTQLWEVSRTITWQWTKMTPRPSFNSKKELPPIFNVGSVRPHHSQVHPCSRLLSTPDTEIWNLWSVGTEMPPSMQSRRQWHWLLPQNSLLPKNSDQRLAWTFCWGKSPWKTSTWTKPAKLSLTPTWARRRCTMRPVPWSGGRKTQRATLHSPNSPKNTWEYRPRLCRQRGYFQLPGTL